MCSAATLLLHYNVDCLAAVPGNEQLIAGVSNFAGQLWTGGIAILTAADRALALQSLMELRTGVPAVVCLDRADEFTGQRVLASGGDDGSVELWYLRSEAGASGQPLERAQAKVLHNNAVLGLAAAPGASQLASVSADGTLRLWDCGQLLACTAQLGSSGGGAALNATAWTGPSTLAAASQAGQLCLWDTRQLASKPAAAAAAGAPALSLATAASLQQQQQLVVGDQLGRLSVFDLRSLGRPLQQQQLHHDAVHALAATSSGNGGGGTSGSGSLLASGGDDGSIMLLDCASLQASRQLVPPRQEGDTPCYMRTLIWQQQQQQKKQQWQLYRGGWDQVVAGVPL